MEIIDAVERLTALASPPRLAAFRLLVQAGREGVRSGQIADALGAPANTTSTHLAILTRAGLITSRREGRSIIYVASYEATAKLIGYLVEDCCGGHPEVCAPVLDALRRGGCASTAV